MILFEFRYPCHIHSLFSPLLTPQVSTMAEYQRCQKDLVDKYT